jgi:hypothetical protein
VTIADKTPLEKAKDFARAAFPAVHHAKDFVESELASAG